MAAGSTSSFSPSPCPGDGMPCSTLGTGCPPAPRGTPIAFKPPTLARLSRVGNMQARPGHTRQIPRAAPAELQGRPPGSYLPRDAPGRPSSSSGQAAAFPPLLPSSSAPHPLHDSGRVRKTPQNQYFRADPALGPRGAPMGADVVGSLSCSQKDMGAWSKERAKLTKLAQGCKE